MKIWIVIVSMLLWAGVPVTEAQDIKTEKERLSYSMGVITGIQMSNQLKRQDVNIDIDLFLKGLKDAATNGKLLISEKEAQEIMTRFQKELGAKQAEKNKQLSEKNKKEGSAFLAENRKKEGVKVLPSGLQYKIITEGKGKTPKDTDTVTTHYRGTLIDGTEFDSSFKRNQPATFAVNGVIKGWTEALKLMKEGSKWQLFVPSALAYGESGTGAQIGPGATLIFEVELISVSDAAEKKTVKEQKDKNRK